jgi:hypothetical protein
MHKAAVLISASLLRAASADAHPVDEVVQGAYLTIAANEVRLELDITPGRAVAGPILHSLDADGAQHITDDEARTYAIRV